MVQCKLYILIHAISLNATDIMIPISRILITVLSSLFYLLWHQKNDLYFSFFIFLLPFIYVLSRSVGDIPTSRYFPFFFFFFSLLLGNLMFYLWSNQVFFQLLSGWLADFGFSFTGVSICLRWIQKGEPAHV